MEHFDSVSIINSSHMFLMELLFSEIFNIASLDYFVLD